MEVIPFETISVVTTETDEEHVDAYLNKSEKEGLICGICGSTRFEVETISKGTAEVLADGGVILLVRTYCERLLVNKILSCIVCGEKQDRIVLKDKMKGAT
jgi:hypothetical protein